MLWDRSQHVVGHVGLTAICGSTVGLSAMVAKTKIDSTTSLCSSSMRKQNWTEAALGALVDVVCLQAFADKWDA